MQNSRTMIEANQILYARFFSALGGNVGSDGPNRDSSSSVAGGGLGVGFVNSAGGALSASSILRHAGTGVSGDEAMTRGTRQARVRCRDAGTKLCFLVESYNSC
jgi:hypothetical protein